MAASISPIGLLNVLAIAAAPVVIGVWLSDDMFSPYAE
jgi:hypothetical protein